MKEAADVVDEERVQCFGDVVLVGEFESALVGDPGVEMLGQQKPKQRR